MSGINSRAFQPETKVLPGLKVVGHVDLTQFKKETKVPKPESKSAKVPKPAPKKENNRNTIGNAITNCLGGRLVLNFEEEVYQTIEVRR